MSIKLVALDIDGTTLNSKGKLLSSTIKAVKKARQQGVEVVFCSGRSLYQEKPYIDKLGMKYVSTINGSVIRKIDGQILKENLLKASSYERLANYSIMKNLVFNFVDEDFNIYTPATNVKPIIYKQAFENNSMLYIRKPEEMTPSIHVTKACFSGTPEMMDKCEQDIKDEFGADFYVVRCSPNFVEVFNPKANKGDAVAEMAEILHIDPQDVMVIGDERNDIPMFKFAHIGVCMGNGNPEAKKYADYVTADNDHDGIAKAFEKFIF